MPTPVAVSNVMVVACALDTIADMPRTAASARVIPAAARRNLGVEPEIVRACRTALRAVAANAGTGARLSVDHEVVSLVMSGILLRAIHRRPGQLRNCHASEGTRKKSLISSKWLGLQKVPHSPV